MLMDEPSNAIRTSQTLKTRERKTRRQELGRIG